MKYNNLYSNLKKNSVFNLCTCTHFNQHSSTYLLNESQSANSLLYVPTFPDELCTHNVAQNCEKAYQRDRKMSNVSLT